MRQEVQRRHATTRSFLSALVLIILANIECCPYLAGCVQLRLYRLHTLVSYMNLIMICKLGYNVHEYQPPRSESRTAKELDYSIAGNDHSILVDKYLHIFHHRLQVQSQGTVIAKIARPLATRHKLRAFTSTCLSSRRLLDKYISAYFFGCHTTAVSIPGQ
ncbi:hypothetical protein V1517DRAFT_313773 [Lipomyces orientalis]|uniref:Uncharacterized protein n=1 Tax=Lipomyces orientalis TaxID=1233043 RepID=A0ACC3TXQ5_9ASCO